MMSDLINMLEHQAKLFDRQGSVGLSDLMWSSKLRIEKLEQQMSESEKLRYESIEIWSGKLDKAKAKIDKLEKQKSR